jgi:hypothetical protein
MNATYKDSEKTMNSVVGSLPDQTQRDFKKVVAMPDVMNLLTDRIDLTVSLGEAYKNDPQGVRQNLDSLNEKLTAQNDKDLQDYKDKVASDPQLQEEMKKSAQDFAGNYDEVSASGYTDASAAPAATTQPTVVNNYYTDPYANPYPYWFGYPYWYSSPMWYPRPLYYQTGFYIGAGGGLVVVGMPSYAYSNWFFTYGYRRYPRLYSHYNVYYNVHRTNITRVNVYRGFNTSARDHFYRVNHIDNRNVNRGRETRVSNPPVTRQNTSTPRSNNATRTEGFRNSINYRGSNFNSGAVRNFHAQEYHQQAWHSVGGGARMGGGGAPHSSGFGGGGHAGGGGGRRGR